MNKTFLQKWGKVILFSMPGFFCLIGVICRYFYDFYGCKLFGAGFLGGHYYVPDNVLCDVLNNFILLLVMIGTPFFYLFYFILLPFALRFLKKSENVDFQLIARRYYLILTIILLLPLFYIIIIKWSNIIFAFKDVPNW